MDLKTKAIILSGLAFLFTISTAYAGWAQKPEFRFTHLYHYDTRQDMRNSYIDSISVAFTYLNDEDKPLLKLMPFFETRRNIKWSFWEKKSLGIEIGKDILSWLYFGESIRQVWAREDYRNWYIPLYIKRNYLESLTRLYFTHSLLSARNFKLKGFLLEEYTFDLDKGRGTFNEVAAGVIFPIGKNIETTVNWRHIDRITYYDSDCVEASLSLVF